MGVVHSVGYPFGPGKDEKMSVKVLAHLLRVLPRLVHWSTRVSASSLPVWMVNWVHDMPPSLSQAGCSHSSVAHWESTWQHPHHSRTCGPHTSQMETDDVLHGLHDSGCSLKCLARGIPMVPIAFSIFHPTMLIIVPSGNLRKTNTLR